MSNTIPAVWGISNGCDVAWWLSPTSVCVIREMRYAHTTQGDYGNSMHSDAPALFTAFSCPSHTLLGPSHTRGRRRGRRDESHLANEGSETQRDGEAGLTSPRHK